MVWPHVEELVTAACERSGGRLMALDILTALTTGKMQLWGWWGETAPQAIAVTEIREYPAMKACRIVICTGEGRGDWVHESVARIEAWARDEGCSVIEGSMRPGWERVLGWKKTHVMLEKAL